MMVGTMAQCDIASLISRQIAMSQHSHAQRVADAAPLPRGYHSQINCMQK